MLGLDAQFNIISYAVISSKYEKNQNISLSFIPLLEHVLLSIDGNYIPSKQIYELFKETYGYEIPPAVMNYLLKILKTQEKIEFLKGENIEIIKENIQDYDNRYVLESSLKSLETNIDIYLKKQGFCIEKTQIINNVLLFIIKNAIEFNSFINYNSNLDFPKSKEDNNFDDILVSFLLEERRNDTKDYKFIKDIYFGVILASLISAGNEQTTIDEKKNFVVENVILDSNYIFRLLNLQTELEYLAAQHTYKTLKEKGCSFCVARDTLKQIADTIHNAIDNYSTTANHILRISGEERFAGLASACLRRELSAADLEKIISKLEGTLSEHYSVTILDDSEFNSVSIEMDDTFKSLCSEKPLSSTLGIIHDLKLIHFVRNKRSSNIYCMQQAKWWVLTDDYKLTKWNAKNIDKNNVLECITESQLATVMWLNEPQVLSHDSLFSTALALRNRTLLGNAEFEKISRAIETQKEKFASDPASLDKLALVFSQKLINLDDLAKEDIDKHDELFAQSMKSAEDFSQKHSLLLEENAKLKDSAEKAEIDHQLERIQAADAIALQKSLLSSETISHVETLKKLLNEKRDKQMSVQGKIELKEKKIKAQNRFSKVFLGIVLFAGIVMLSLYAQSKFGDWYQTHQLVCWLISSGAAIAFLVVFGIPWHNACTKAFDKLSNLFVKLLILLHIFKNHSKTIEKLDEQLSNITEEIKSLLNDIDAKVKVN